MKSEAKHLWILKSIAIGKVVMTTLALLFSNSHPQVLMNVCVSARVCGSMNEKLRVSQAGILAVINPIPGNIKRKKSD